MVKNVKFLLNSSECYPGSTVQGKVAVSVDKPEKYRSISVELWGGANVRWTEAGNDDEDYYDVFTNSETYVQIHTVVWKPENSPTGELPAGEHYFPFSFQLPQNVPSSFFGAHGKIEYELRTKIEHSGVLNFLIKSDYKLAAPLVVKERKPSTYFKEPAVVSKSKKLGFLCFKFGSVSATVNIPRTGFSPGEHIPLSINVDNQSSRRISIATALQRTDTFIGFSRRKQRNNVAVNSVARTVSSAIEPRQITSYEEKNLVIPTEAFATIRNCSCIRVEYVLHIQIIIPWSFNIHLDRPIGVYGTLSSGQPHPYLSQPPQQAVMHMSQPLQQAAACLLPQAVPYSQPQVPTYGLPQASPPPPQPSQSTYLPQPPAVYPQPPPPQQEATYFSPQQIATAYPQPQIPPQYHSSHSPR